MYTVSVHRAVSVQTSGNEVSVEQSMVVWTVEQCLGTHMIDGMMYMACKNQGSICDSMIGMCWYSVPVHILDGGMQYRHLFLLHDSTVYQQSMYQPVYHTDNPSFPSFSNTVVQVNAGVMSHNASALHSQNVTASTT